jgi:hypothetical protein
MWKENASDAKEQIRCIYFCICCFTYLLLYTPDCLCACCAAGRPKNATSALQRQPEDIQHGDKSEKPGLPGRGAKRDLKRKRSSDGPTGPVPTGKKHISKLVAKYYAGHVDINHPKGIWIGKVVKAWHHADDASLQYSIFFEDGWPLVTMSEDELEQAFWIFNNLPTDGNE